MLAYRLFPIAEDGRIADAPLVIEALHDGAALVQGERVLSDRAHEVWQGARLVGTVVGRPAHDRLTDVRSAFDALPYPRRR